MLNASALSFTKILVTTFLTVLLSACGGGGGGSGGTPNSSAGSLSNFAGNLGSAGYRDATGALAMFNTPLGIATDASGNVYVADRDNHIIRKITPAGVVTTFAGLAASAGSVDGSGAAARFYMPSGVAVDASGIMYVADTYNHTIRKISTTGVVTTLAGTAGLNGSADGSGAAARFYLPMGIATDANSNVYVADYNSQTIRKITPTGVVTTLAGTVNVSGNIDATGSAARFNYPFGIAVDASGNVYSKQWGQVLT